MVFRGSNLEIKLKFFILNVFLSNLISNYLQMTKWYPSSKEGQYTYSYQPMNLEPLFCDFRGSFAI